MMYSTCMYTYCTAVCAVCLDVPYRRVMWRSLSPLELGKVSKLKSRAPT